MSKNHRPRFLSLFILMLALFSLSVVAAQDSPDDQPLLKMLANIPNTSLSRTEIYFNDRTAFEVAYPPAKMPKDWAEFKAMTDAKGENANLLPVDIWWRAWRNQSSASSAQYLGASEDTPSVVGFDYFQIEQEMSYGTPPNQALQLVGHFNLDAVRAAFNARGYTRKDQDGVEVWCSSDGCDSGTKISAPDRNPANPFGGTLGRTQPLFVEDDTLISSPSETIIQDHVDLATGSEESLADLPQYRAIADAITADGSLLQAYFWDGKLIADMSVLSPASVIFGEQATLEKVKQFFQEMLKDYETLPPYQLLALADVASESQQMGEVALVYANEADAKTAAAVLPKRIANYQSITLKRSLTGILARYRVTEPVVKVVESNGLYVVVVAFPTTKATAEELLKFDIRNPNPPDVTAPGLIYKLLVDSALRRDLNWLSTVPRSAIEAMAK